MLSCRPYRTALFLCWGSHFAEAVSRLRLQPELGKNIRLIPVYICEQLAKAS